MINYYIISNASRASNYGIGTYTCQLQACLTPCADVRVSYIDMFANTQEFLKETDEVGYMHYKIPVISGNVEDEVSCKNAFYYLLQHINDENDSSLIFHFNYFQHYYLAIMLKIAFPKCRIVLTIHYLNWCFELNGNETLFRHYISTATEGKVDKESDSRIQSVRNNFKLERNFMSLADDVVVLSKATKNIIINDYKIHKDKLSLIYNGLDISDIPEATENSVDSFIGNNFKYLLYVGRLDDIKGVTYLIKAFNKLSKEDEKLHLIIVGDGNFTSCLNAAKGNWERITFTGKISKEDLRLIYPKIALGILPSFHEQCSYAAIEMMAHGIPMVITDSTGLKEMLEDCPSCIIPINNDNFSEDEFVETIYHTIHQLISDNDRLLEASQLVKRLYQERYTLSVMGKGYLSLLNSANRPVFSKDLLYMIDRRMISLIDSCPDIDTSFFGMTGIGCYLWYRICTMKNTPDKQDISQSLLLQEYMIYWMDWIYETLQLGDEQYPAELSDLTKELKDNMFYTIQANKLANATENKVQEKNTDEITILANALKIFRCKI